MSAVLQHVRKYRPHWVVDYVAEEGKHQVGRGLCFNHYPYGAHYKAPHYDAEIQIILYDTWANFGDRPNTRVSSTLHERFGLPWDADCGRYSVAVRLESVAAARTLLYGWHGLVKSSRKSGGAQRRDDTRYVAVHYEGDSSQSRKNLTHSQADSICQAIMRLGYCPLILDWRNRSPLPYPKVTTPADWGGDAEMVCATISQCAAFIGIDSGPSKCASATETPSLVIWTRHHPAPFHDPAQNTTHLVPLNYHGLEPVCSDRGVIEFFESHYNTRVYHTDPVGDVELWLREALYEPSSTLTRRDCTTAEADRIHW